MVLGLCAGWIDVVVFSQTLPLSWQVWTRPLPPFHHHPIPGPKIERTGGLGGGSGMLCPENLFYNKNDNKKYASYGSMRSLSADQGRHWSGKKWKY